MNTVKKNKMIIHCYASEAERDRAEMNRKEERFIPSFFDFKKPELHFVTKDGITPLSALEALLTIQNYDVTFGIRTIFNFISGLEKYDISAIELDLYKIYARFIPYNNVYIFGTNGWKIDKNLLEADYEFFYADEPTLTLREAILSDVKQAMKDIVTIIEDAHIQNFQEYPYLSYNNYPVEAVAMGMRPINYYPPYDYYFEVQLYGIEIAKERLMQRIHS